MFHLARGAALGALLFAGSGIPAAEPPHWGYYGETGPAHWGELSPAYADCRDGQAQSPINLGPSQPAGLAPLRLRYRASPVELVNNGHTVQVNVGAGSLLTLDGKDFELKQLHFHTPSEHTLLGRSLPLEIHLVHQAGDGELAVIGVLAQAGFRPHPLLRQLWKHLPARAGDHSQAGGLRINPAGLLPPTHHYVTYSGSLTTPPCSEGVRWVVMQSPLRITRQQAERFSRLIGDNARPVQPGNGRPVFALH
jgi:carbonic anhydrase